MEPNLPYTRKIHFNVLLVLSSLGEKSIAESTDLFSFVDPDFHNWNTYKHFEEDGCVALERHEIITAGCFAQFFRSISQDLDSLVLSQEYIVSFIRTQRNIDIFDGDELFFLAESISKTIYVVYVYIQAWDEIKVYAHHLSLNAIWRPKPSYKIFVPAF